MKTLLAVLGISFVWFLLIYPSNWWLDSVIKPAMLWGGGGFLDYIAGFIGGVGATGLVVHVHLRHFNIHKKEVPYHRN